MKNKNNLSFKEKNQTLINPLTLINYQEGGVVSKEILKTKSGTITLFAFDKNQGLSRHTTPFEAMVYILDGEANITIAGKSNIVKKGEIIQMPKNIPHALKAEKRFKMILTMLK